MYDLNNPGQGWADISATAAMPSPRNHFSTIELNGLIYAIGGQYGHDQCPTGSGIDTTLVHRFDPQTLNWERLNDLPGKQSHAEPGTFVYAGKIYMVGGKIKGNAVMRYNEEDDSWEKILDLPQTLLAPVSRIVDDVLYVIGGGAPLARFPTNKNYAIDVSDLVDHSAVETDNDPVVEPETDNEPQTPQIDPPVVETDDTVDSDAPVIVFEAEHFDSISANATHSWNALTDGAASNDGAMIAGPDVGTLKRDTDSPLLTYNINFASAGQYHLWVRGRGDTGNNGEGKSDSIYVSTNGNLPGAAGEVDYFPPQWTWTRSTRANATAAINIPSAGTHTIRVWMREDGVALDKFLLTKDSQYTPANEGPGQSSVDTTPVNLAPQVNAGNDATFVLGQPIVLNGIVSDDGLPGNNLTYSWAVEAGDATVAQGSTLSPAVSVIQPGVYRFKLTASDGELSHSDDVTVTVEAASVINDDADANADEPTGDAPDETEENNSTDGAPNPVVGNNQLLVIEAEQFTARSGSNSHNWVEAGLTGASGGQSLIALPDNGTLLRSAVNNPMLSYQVSFDQAGTYYLWLRGWGDTSTVKDGKSDSVYIGLNGQFPTANGEIGQFPAGWHWTQRTRQNVVATLSVPSAGTHTVNLWMREDGLALDKLILTMDGDYQPSGSGPDAGDDGDSEATDNNASEDTTTDDNNTDNTPDPVVNTAPVVTAMDDQTIVIGDALTLHGTASDDGLPGNGLTTTWHMVSGPLAADIDNNDALSTSVYFADIGTYVFELTATDGELSNSDSVTITVEEIVIDDLPAGDMIVVEAEQYIDNTAAGGHSWQLVNQAGASGGAAMSALPNNGRLNRTTDSPELSYSVYFAEAGTYYLWIRGWGDTAANGKGRDDSIHAGLNGQLAATADEIEQFPASWNWSQDTRGNHVATLTIPSAGTHTVNLWMREDGFTVDQFILTKDLLFVPTGQISGDTDADTTTDEVNQQGTVADVNTGSSEPVVTAVDATQPWDLWQTSDGSAVTHRHETGAVVVDDRIYVVGGRYNKPVESFDALTNRWMSHGRAPVDVHHFQPVEYNGKIYVIGALRDGGYPVENALDNIYIYDPANDTWTMGDEIPASRRRGSTAAAVYNNKIYIVGGNTRGHSGPSVAWMDEYNPVTGEWTIMPDAPNARDHATVAIADGKLVFAGGRRSAHPNVFGDTEGDTDIFDFATGTWSSDADPIPTQRAGTMAVAHGHEVVIIGGESNASTQAHANVEAVDVRTGKWRSLQPLLIGRHSGAAAILNGMIHVISGNSTRGGGNEITDHEILPLP
jgi:N-acetylneuraminic acid mutarotase